MRVSERDLPVDAPPGPQSSTNGTFHWATFILVTTYARSLPWEARPARLNIRLVNGSNAGRYSDRLRRNHRSLLADWPPACTSVFFDRHEFKEGLYVSLRSTGCRMWRRAISEAELDRKLALWRAIRPTTSGWKRQWSKCCDYSVLLNPYLERKQSLRSRMTLCGSSADLRGVGHTPCHVVE